ncbi:regulatory protein GemA [Salmonella enterica]|uniref:Regulatory protein GemA n=2 Tax=Salmonella enterica TaxID=28901 RepID=A0A5Y2LSC9_SALER|nr:regulatory protein GemA [Salmonella enterica subsp. enterica serovar Potsdam]EBD9851161.1 regulatory protein GemA [Salmonella enterica]EBF9679722.1 regulatory protein GemA [Salmonella enterica subsp. enterica serovar Glostrup]EBS4874932.1 regulatory protein GemA [Salmonella enterica subsp. enterica serovar Hvittingfoss]EBU9251083.1 regulatory protein GemA [Salmonella enterica subsp. enterica serovar Oslo]ECE6361027.1 regulatory protein GemA [Salmonella enterica subsp. salamae]ECH1487290.1 
MKRNLIRIIHTGKSCLGWDDETYRDVLFRQTGKRSARDCSVSELEKTVLYMRTQGFAPSSRGRRPRVATGRKAILSKIEALLADAGRPWGYLDGITERMLGEKKPVEWLDDEQIYKVMQMLIVDAARHGRL